jgi:arylsulfatase A-like enzyme
MMDRTRSTGLALAAIAACMAPPIVAGDADLPKSPNIVLILTDDAGYGDFGFQGSTQFRTPHIDRLAAEGIRFTQGYVTASVCSPSRAGLLTGRYQQRFGHEYNIPRRPEPTDDPADMGLPPSEITIAEALREQGYVTGAIGKWHLGEAAAYHPLEHGFDSFFGFLWGASGYFPDGRQQPILRDREVQDPQPYLTDAFGAEACRFIRAHRDEPFFLYLSFNAVHTPMHAKPDDIELYGDVEPKKRRTLAAMTKALDDQVGAILGTLDELELTSNTMVIFLNDNGGACDVNASINAPLHGQKGTLLEGGVRVPFVIRWPGGFTGGMTCDQPVSALDIFPTVLTAAGATEPIEPERDGVDLLPYLRGEVDHRPHEKLYWRRAVAAAVRDGDWKLIRLPDRPPMLFDLATDPGEQHDLHERHPERVRAMMKDLFAWELGTVHPKWVTAPMWRKRNVQLYDRTYQMSQPE